MEQFPQCELSDNSPVEVNLGTTKIKVDPVYQDVWRFDFQREGEETQTRLLILEKAGKIVTLPAYLDLPVLLKFDTPVEVGPKNKKVFYLSLPLQVEVVVETEHDEISIEKVIPVTLKRAWYGQPHSGDLSYYFVTPVFYTLEEAEKIPGEALLPVRVRNLNDATHIIEKLMVDSYQLSLYEKDNALLAEVIEVVFLHGEAEIDYTDEAPFPDCKEILRGEESAKKKGFSKLTRRRLKRITQELFGSAE